METLIPPEQTRILISDTFSGAPRPFIDNAAVKLSSRGAPWEESLIMEVAEVGPADMGNCYLHRPTIVLHLNNASNPIERITNGQHQTRQVFASGAMHFDPPGLRTSVRWNDPLKILALMPSDLSIQRVLSETQHSANREFMPASNVHDPQIKHIGLALLTECQNGFESGRLYGESLALALVARLLSRFSTTPVAYQNRNGGLPLWRLRQVMQFIDENIGSDLSLSVLASAANFSEYYFCRLFKQSTGMSPHTYVMRQRMSRARDLLARSRRTSIDDIGVQLGFKNQAHFTTAFKKASGMTPTQFRNRS